MLFATKKILSEQSVGEVLVAGHCVETHAGGTEITIELPDKHLCKVFRTGGKHIKPEDKYLVLLCEKDSQGALFEKKICSFSKMNLESLNKANEVQLKYPDAF